jgi:hypothetical protein
MFANPYQDAWKENGEWLKANFHVHAVPDGGEIRPFQLGRYTVTPKHVSEVIAAYRDAGYDVLMIANQGFFLDTQEYAKKHDILMINGIEYVEEDGILCIGATEFISGEPQKIIDECTRQGALAVLCHPHWLRGRGMPPKLSLQTMNKLRGYAGIEVLTAGIFNGFEGSGLATDVWDEYLSAGKLVWGFANDDFHTWFDIDRGWNVIYSRGRDLQSLKRAIEQGNLYASTGLVLRQFSFQGGVIEVEANLEPTPADTILYEFVGENGQVLRKSSGKAARYHFEGNEKYVRVRALSENGAILWTQPVYDADKLRRP